MKHLFKVLGNIFWNIIFFILLTIGSICLILWDWELNPKSNKVTNSWDTQRYISDEWKELFSRCTIKLV